ncbi:hypothetical protein F8S13_17225 [Chloroflexia bacterium SDU3-3]|nr:hypothetical protein F8S13_17225 [Chloroflexia bacterium SDU3-3]
MPRVHIQEQDAAWFEEHDDEPQLLMAAVGEQRPERRGAAERGGQGVRRINGSDALDRKRAERRKSQRRRG